jgi:hypothetical protein
MLKIAKFECPPRKEGIIYNNCRITSGLNKFFMTDQQFSDLMKVLRSIDSSLDDIKSSIPDSESSKLRSIVEKLDVIDSSIKDVEFAITNKE